MNKSRPIFKKTTIFIKNLHGLYKDIITKSEDELTGHCVSQWMSTRRKKENSDHDELQHSNKSEAVIKYLEQFGEEISWSPGVRNQKKIRTATGLDLAEIKAYYQTRRIELKSQGMSDKSLKVLKTKILSDDWQDDVSFNNRMETIYQDIQNLTEHRYQILAYKNNCGITKIKNWFNKRRENDKLFNPNSLTNHVTNSIRIFSKISLVKILKKISLKKSL